jgi:nucleoside-diphosphate-sugar epimerase
MAESPNSIGEVINVGSSKEITIGDLAQKISVLLGKKGEIVHDSDRIRPEASEVERLQADIKKAKKLLNWEPRTSLDEGLTQTIEWVRGQMSFYPEESYQV